MNDLLLHAFLFVVGAAVVVAIGALFAEPDDGAARRVFFPRLRSFLVASALVVGVMLLVEATLARI